MQRSSNLLYNLVAGSPVEKVGDLPGACDSVAGGVAKPLLEIPPFVQGYIQRVREFFLSKLRGVVSCVEPSREVSEGDFLLCGHPSILGPGRESVYIKPGGKEGFLHIVQNLLIFLLK